MHNRHQRSRQHIDRNLSRVTKSQLPTTRTHCFTGWSGPLVGYGASEIVNTAPITDTYSGRQGWQSNQQDDFNAHFMQQQRNYDFLKIKGDTQYGRGPSSSLSVGARQPFNGETNKDNIWFILILYTNIPCYLLKCP
jgi:hypothetical protein